ncbi:MAG: outer membrane protein assembly factor BamE [Betaproteobacteria bacterium]|nr:outer membrane protein assembly factor BamE [Betaproteobacteria bacterium]
MRQFLTLLTVLALAGCKQAPELPAVISPYKIDIQQGNVVSQAMVSKLKAGMTRAQVRFALGSPLIVDMFRTDRWDYVYMYQKQGKEPQRHRITIIFEDDRLLRIEGDVVPVYGAQEPETSVAGPQLAAPPAPKPDAEAGAKPAPPKPESGEDKEKPKEEKGFFGRMLDKIGF